MRAFGIVLLPPGLNDLLGVRQGHEVMLVQALVAQAAVEALDEAVLDGMPGKALPYQESMWCGYWLWWCCTFRVAGSPP
jgi:hypothetical protein